MAQAAWKQPFLSRSWGQTLTPQLEACSEAVLSDKHSKHSRLEREELAADILGTPRTSAGLAHFSEVVKVALSKADLLGPACSESLS